jgi:hypothetical protein
MTSDQRAYEKIVIASAAKQSRAARAEAWIASSASPPRNDGSFVGEGRA